jgi:hypothetical protein
VTTFFICVAVYFAIPVVGIWISGRQLMWQGWVLYCLLWPVWWLFAGPEELP